MAQSPPRSARPFCWLFILVGLGIVGCGVWTLIKSIRTNDWPITNGVIQSAHQHSESGGEGGTTYSAAVTYIYQVADLNYTGNKIAIGQMSSSSDYAQGILNRYPVGKKIPVHYSPTNPAEAVLETGVHGGTWICFIIGTVLVLMGTMFQQLSRAATKAQMPGAPQASSVTMAPDGSIAMNKPPLLMGVIFLIAGVSLCFATPSNGVPHWVIYAAGGMFGLIGVFIILLGLQNKMFSKIAMLLVLALFLAIFHWVSFGLGERIGTSTTPFSQRSGVNVKTPFAIFTLLLDAIIVTSVIHRMVKRKKTDDRRRF